MNKRITSILLAVLMLVSMLAIAVSATDPQPNVTWQVNAPNGVSPGGTFTVKVSNKAMTAAAIAFGISFDADKLEVDVDSISKVEDSPFTLVKEFTEDSARQLIPSTDEEIQTMEKIGFEGKASTDNVEYKAGAIATITFKVKKDADLGTLSLYLYESSAKVVGEDVEDNYHVSSDDTTEVKTVEIVEPSEQTLDVTAIGGTTNKPSYTVNGQTVTVTHNLACKVGYEGTDGKYVAINASVNANGGYDFTVPDGVSKVVVVVKGDVNGDGKVTMADSTIIKNIYLGNIKNLSVVQLFASNVNADNKITMADSTIAKNVYLGNIDLLW